MLNISGMNEGFRERAHQTRALLEADTTAFVLVTGPMPERLDEAHLLPHDSSCRTSMRVAAVVVNRVHRPRHPSCGRRWHASPHPLQRTAREDAGGGRAPGRSKTPRRRPAPPGVRAHAAGRWCRASSSTCTTWLRLYEASRWLWDDLASAAIRAFAFG